MAIMETIGAQLRIVFAVASRDTQLKTSESPLGILSPILEPLATLMVMTIIVRSIRPRHTGLGDYVLLLLMTGILPISQFRGAISGGERTFRRMRRLLVMPQLRPLDLILGGILANFVTVSILFLAITIFFHVVLATAEPENLMMSLVPAVGNACIGFGFCCVSLTIKTWFPFWQTLFNIVLTPVGILSGMFFTAESLPPSAQKILYWNPFMHSTELCRTFFFTDFTSTFFDPYYYGAWVAGSLFVGLVVERTFRYRLLGTKA